ncbi:prepilin-type cleavage/methylation domain-containing protein [Sesbania bispinosa]|nr:prepilin-type cleavage/methylation domain-containing protein [Sesbania bispinosa]
MLPLCACLHLHSPPSDVRSPPFTGHRVHPFPSGRATVQIHHSSPVTPPFRSTIHHRSRHLSNPSNMFQPSPSFTDCSLVRPRSSLIALCSSQCTQNSTFSIPVNVSTTSMQQVVVPLLKVYTLALSYSKHFIF